MKRITPISPTPFCLLGANLLPGAILRRGANRLVNLALIYIILHCTKLKFFFLMFYRLGVRTFAPSKNVHVRTFAPPLPPTKGNAGVDLPPLYFYHILDKEATIVFFSHSSCR